MILWGAVLKHDDQYEASADGEAFASGGSIAVHADSSPASHPAGGLTMRLPGAGCCGTQRASVDNSAGGQAARDPRDMSSDVVFSPCQAVSPADTDVHLLLLLQDSAEQLLLPAWSSLDRLVQACGEQQPWVSLRLCDLDGVRASTGAVAVLLDALAPWPAA
jgi:hypothetical protein